jgi:DNA polymerase III subunit gamma/tau
VASLVSRYRPQIFEKVVGQEVPVRFLSELIVKGRRCRNVLLHGSIGSGKTSLARIYAKALSCKAPSPRGSPCLNCEACNAIEAGEESHFLELDAPSFRNFGEFRDKIDNHLTRAKARHLRCVIFVDEAHSLSNHRNCFDFLLKKVDNAGPKTAFCFATTSFDRISKALRSRLDWLELRPLSRSESIKFLERIASEEGLKAENEALALIAGLGEGQPRNMLQGLDLVSETGDVTRDRVREVFGVNHTEFLTRYFEALGDGNFSLQTDIFFRWDEAVGTKLKWIQLFLVSLYYNELRHIKLSIDPVITSISSVERNPIISAFRKRLGESDIVAFWEVMMRFWPVITPDLSEESLLILVTQFQRQVSAPLNAALQSPPLERHSFSLLNDVPPSRPRRSAFHVGVRHKGKERRPKHDPKYLSFGQVREIFNTASFLPQEYGWQFSGQITIRHRLFGCKSQTEASRLFRDFNRALDDRLKHWINHSRRLSVQENNDEQGFCGRIIAVLPSRTHRTYDFMRRWLAEWRRELRFRGQEEEAISWVVAPTSIRKLNFHWECVRWICAGLNPNDPVHRKLKLDRDKLRVAGLIGSSRRFSSSQSIGPKGVEYATRNKMHLLSAFDDEAWARLYEGWELDEHIDRLKHKADRENDVADLGARFPVGGGEDSKRKAAMNQLRDSWPDKYRRHRSWTLWEMSR